MNWLYVVGGVIALLLLAYLTLALLKPEKFS
jgi:K+-transporting ATPase KdpF subunit